MTKRYSEEDLIGMNDDNFNALFERVLEQRNSGILLREKLCKDDFSQRTQRVFWYHQFETYADILKYTEEEFLNLPRIGVITLEDIKRGLRFKGLKFKETKTITS